MCGLRLACVQYNVRAVHLAMVMEMMPPEQLSVIMILKTHSVTNCFWPCAVNMIHSDN